MLFIGLSIGEAKQNYAQSSTSNEEKEVFCLVLSLVQIGSRK